MTDVNGTRQPMGVSFQLLSLLRLKLNFTYDLIFPENNIYGSTNDMKGSLIEVLNTSVSYKSYIGPITAIIKYPHIINKKYIQFNAKQLESRHGRSIYTGVARCPKVH